jgi:hypothetical protein
MKKSLEIILIGIVLFSAQSRNIFFLNVNEYESMNKRIM